MEKRNLLWLTMLITAFVFFSCGDSDNDTEQPQVQTQYSNPVVDYGLPDPSLIKASDGRFYLYATESNIRNMPIYSSADLVHWKYERTAFNDKTRPSFVVNGRLWAPDINYIAGQYVMYYAMSVWGGVWDCGIGVAVAAKPSDPFADKGMLFRSSEIKVKNSIDPCYVEESGKKYLFFGSYNGIYYVELSDDGLSLKTPVNPIKVVGTAYEGTCIHKHDGYYYLFASTGTCCNGATSTYTTVYGRSTSLFGPYLNKKGESMMDNKHEILIHNSDKFVGTGHNSEIVSDDAGNDWIFYHAYPLSNPVMRELMLDRVIWQDGWPSVVNQIPSEKAPAPIFNSK